MDGQVAVRRFGSTVLLGLAFVTLAVATRLPFRDRTLFISDSGRYALALEHYDMTLGRPHPPGNPLYVGMAKAIDSIVHDPPASLAILSALMSGIAFLFAYLLGRDVSGEEAGWVAAGILATSPLFWYFGALAMPATGEAALSLVVAWIARRARLPEARGAFWAMTIALAIAFGFRSTFAVLVFPLWLYAAWRHPKARIAAGAATLVAAAASWTVLVALLSGGLAAYGAVSSGFFLDVVLQTKILGGGLTKIPGQAYGIAVSAVLGLGFFVVPCLSGAWGCLTSRWPFPGAAPFLAAWALPAVAFHAAYDWAPRFGVLLLAPASILAATAVAPVARRFARAARGGDSFPRAATLLALAVNLGVFLVPARIGGLSLPEPFPSGSRLLARNADLARRDAAIRASCDPKATVLLAYDDTFHLAWFLPEYRVVGLWGAFKKAPDTWLPSAFQRTFSFEPGSKAIPVGDPMRLPDAVRYAVLYDADYERLWPRASLPTSELRYDVGRRLLVAAVPGPGCLAFGLGSIEYRRAGESGCPAGESPAAPDPR
jgi:hypothetical protein